MGHKILHFYVSLNDPYAFAASPPEKCLTKHKKTISKRQTECLPTTLQHAINPSFQMFASPKLCGSIWKHYPTLPQVWSSLFALLLNFLSNKLHIFQHSSEEVKIIQSLSSASQFSLRAEHL